MKANIGDEKKQRAAEVETGHRQEIAGVWNGGGIQNETNIGSRSDQKTARRADAEHKEVKPARDFCRILDRFGAVERSDGFGKNRVEKIRATEAADPNAFGAVEIGAHQIGATKFGTEQIRVAEIGLSEIGSAQIGHRQIGAR